MKLLRFMKRELATEAALWVQDGLVSRSQSEDILARYGASFPDGQKNKDRGYLILMSLAALMVGVALIIVIGANWDEIPRWTRMGMMVSLVAVTNWIGFAKYKNGETGIAGVILLLGSLFYGAAIMLIAQIYHLGEHVPDEILLWAVGVVPVAILAKNRAILFLGQVLALIWMTLEFEMGYLPVFYLAFGACFLWFAIKIKPSVVIYLVGLAGLVTFFELALAHGLNEGTRSLHLGVVHVFYSVGILLVLLSAAKLFVSSDFPGHIVDYAFATRIWAFRLGLVFLFVLSFEDLASEMLRSAQGQVFPIQLIGVVAALLVALSYLRRAGFKLKSLASVLRKEALEVGASVVFVSLCLAMPVLNQEQGVFVALLVNLLLLWTGLHVLISGMKTGSGVKYYVGLSIILALAICRYFSLIGDYWGGAAMFGFAGLVMFFAARYWRTLPARREGGRV